MLHILVVFHLVLIVLENVYSSTRVKTHYHFIFNLLTAGVDQISFVIKLNTSFETIGDNT